MKQESRTEKTLLNARVNIIFYFLTLALSFFSRRIFLEMLGDDFIGLISTLQNLLGFLNIVELGVGVAIGYILYKPLFEENQHEINEIISIFGYIYRQIGFLILFIGILFSFFLSQIFSDACFNKAIIYLSYFAFLGSSLIGYFINYKQTLLSADQKNYVVTAYFQTINIVKTILQMVFTYYTKNYYLWIIIEFTFGIIYSFILNYKIKQSYPWLHSDIQSGKKLLVKYPDVIKLTKQVFVHKIGGIAQFQMTPFLIFAFVSLQTVAYYGNYSLITQKLEALLNNFLNSTGAGIGNLIAEGDKNKIMKVYWELMAVRFFFAGTIVISMYYLLPIFIELWLGEKYLLNENAFVCILILFALNVIRGTTDQFINGFGLYNDTWSPILESFIYMIVALIGGYYWGLSGVLIGNIISLLLIIYIWKPYFLFKKGFNISVKYYWIHLLKLLILLFLAFIIFYIIHYICFEDYDNNTWLTFVLYSLSIGFILSSILFALMYLSTQGMRSCVKRIYSYKVNKCR